MHPQARLLDLDRIPHLIADYAAAAPRAHATGLDGIELHAATGFRISQFLRSSVNRRTDRYGGTVANRVRLLSAIVAALLDVWPAGRIGVSLTPSGGPGGCFDDDPAETYAGAARVLSSRGLACLHVVRPITHGGGAMTPVASATPLAAMRQASGGPFIANGGRTPKEAECWISEGQANAISFRSSILVKPDLPARIAAGGPCHAPDAQTFNGGRAGGCVDHPTLDPRVAASTTPARHPASPLQTEGSSRWDTPAPCRVSATSTRRSASAAMSHTSSRSAASGTRAGASRSSSSPPPRTGRAFA